MVPSLSLPFTRLYLQIQDRFQCEANNLSHSRPVSTFVSCVSLVWLTYDITLCEPRRVSVVFIVRCCLPSLFNLMITFVNVGVLSLSLRIRTERKMIFMKNLFCFNSDLLHFPLESPCPLLRYSIVTYDF